MANVSLRNISKRYGPVVVIRDQSLDIADGEFMVLLGPSGCGKTTTMRMIAGLDEPTSGEIFIGGARVNDLPPRERDVAMVFQSYGLYPHMSVADNIGYPLKLRGVPRTERAARIAAAARQVELGDYLSRKPGALSGGQRQRVALARAIVRTPRVFLMDEPLSNLDAKLRVSMRAQIKHLQYELGVTTVYVTHDQIEAMTLAHRVAVMDKGAIRQLDTPEAIYDRPADLFVAGFIGSPAMNLVAGRCEGGVFTAEGWRAPVPSGFMGAAILGVRPEDIRIVGPDAGEAAASIYAVELTGESVLVTCDTPAGRVVARAGREFRASIGEPVRLALSPGRLHVFDPGSEKRVD